MRGAPLNEKRRRQSSDDNDKTIARAAVKRLNVAKMKDVYGSLWCCPKCLHACTHLRPFFLVRSLVLGTIDNLFFFFPKGVKSTVFFFFVLFCVYAVYAWVEKRKRSTEKELPRQIVQYEWKWGRGRGWERKKDSIFTTKKKKKNWVKNTWGCSTTPSSFLISDS